MEGADGSTRLRWPPPTMAASVKKEKVFNSKVGDGNFTRRRLRHRFAFCVNRGSVLQNLELTP